MKSRKKINAEMIRGNTTANERFSRKLSKKNAENYKKGSVSYIGPNRFEAVKIREMRK